jgi:predicted nucleotidyltransferase
MKSINKKRMNHINSVLRKIYINYKNRGVLSIYLWGSVITKDFDSKKSDIDSIAIVNNSAKMEDNREINHLLKQDIYFNDFKLNYLYKRELDGGNIKSRLASVIDPRLLLLDFKNWRFVAGKRYFRRNFKLKEITFEKAIRLNILAIKKSHLPHFKKGDFKPLQYFIKNIIKICQYLNERDFGEHKFSYSNLLKISPKNRKNIVKILLKIKRSNWNKKLAKKHLSFLIDFIGSLS